MDNGAVAEHGGIRRPSPHVDDQCAQLALPFDARSGPAIDGALDAVQQRFGSRSVSRATQLRLRPVLEIPRLDD